MVRLPPDTLTISLVDPCMSPASVVRVMSGPASPNARAGGMFRPQSLRISPFGRLARHPHRLAGNEPPPEATREGQASMPALQRFSVWWPRPLLGECALAAPTGREMLRPRPLRVGAGRETGGDKGPLSLFALRCSPCGFLPYIRTVATNAQTGAGTTTPATGAAQDPALPRRTAVPILNCGGR
jgi:hypothetical protein